MIAGRRCGRKAGRLEKHGKSAYFFSSVENHLWVVATALCRREAGPCSKDHARTNTATQRRGYTPQGTATQRRGYMGEMLVPLISKRPERRRRPREL